MLQGFAHCERLSEAQARKSEKIAKDLEDLDSILPGSPPNEVLAAKEIRIYGQNRSKQLSQIENHMLSIRNSLRLAIKVI